MGVGHIEVDEFLDQVLLRIRSHFEGEEKVVDFVPQGSLRKTVDLSLPLEGRGIDSEWRILMNFCAIACELIIQVL